MRAIVDPALFVHCRHALARLEQIVRPAKQQTRTIERDEQAGVPLGRPSSGNRATLADKRACSYVKRPEGPAPTMPALHGFVIMLTGV